MRKLFRTLILRPLRRDLLRSAMTVIAVALGVAVVIAIDLAGTAATGSFQSSISTLAGKTDLEVLANGGIDEQWIGRLSQLPVDARFAPAQIAALRVEPVGYVTIYGIDVVSELSSELQSDPDTRAKLCGDAAPAYVSARLAARLPKSFLVNGYAFCTARTFKSAAADFIVADIADVQQALGRFGKVDRIDIFAGPHQDFTRLELAIRTALPAGYRLVKPGTRKDENQKMLRGFQWNLRILSYIALVVGAFLIYNTISISIVRRRPEIGILRALGASRRSIFLLFLSEAAMFGLAGAALGLVGGWLLAQSMVSLISQTINALYASSSPSPIALNIPSVLLAFAAGLSVALLSAWVPAREATRIAPVEAMGRGSRETTVKTQTGKRLIAAAILSLFAIAAAQPGPVDGRPLFGYLATLLSIAIAALVTPGLVQIVTRALRTPLRVIFGAAGLLAARGLSASLGRTSVVVAALATAIAMMASVGIMVGSFRETVLQWLDSQLSADLYIRAAGPPTAGDYPPISPALAPLLRKVPGVDAVDQFSAFDFSYQGLRATLGAGDLDVQRRHARLRFLQGDRDTIFDSMRHGGQAIVSEPFASKHNVHVGDVLTLPLHEKVVTLHVAGIYYDYSSELGYVIVDRATLLNLFPDQPPTNIALYLKPRADRDRARTAVERAASRFPVSVAVNAQLRRDAIIIFDRTFAITWALEAVAILVAMLGAANALLAMVLDRRREFGMLRYLGAATSQIRRIILVEAALLGLFSILLGASLGLVLSNLLIYVINKQSFGWTIQFHPPLLLLGGAMLLVWAVTVLAGLYPARVAANLKPIEVIHEE